MLSHVSRKGGESADGHEIASSESFRRSMRTVCREIVFLARGIFTDTGRSKTCLSAPALPRRAIGPSCSSLLLVAATLRSSSTNSLFRPIFYFNFWLNTGLQKRPPLKAIKTTTPIAFGGRGSFRFEPSCAAAWLGSLRLRPAKTRRSQFVHQPPCATF